MAIRYSLSVDTATNLDKWKQALNADVTNADATQSASALTAIKAVLKVYQMMATA